MRALPPLLAAALGLLPAPALPAALPVAVPATESPLTGLWRVGGIAAEGTHGRTAELGELKVEATGTYQWHEHNQLAGLGALQPHRPTGGPRAGLDCWRFHRGKGELYAYRDGDTLEVYDAASDALLGKGGKVAAPRRR